ncbi:MAG: enoyl-CoA hydratase/isomerase family protein [Bacteroidales bacterium]|nr:enoyl-CoA hydratase/isomerase family protein [Bacteroidales bacterium]
MDYKTLSVEIRNEVVILKLDFEKKLNSLSQLFFDEFIDVVEALHENKLAKVLIIRGTDKVFSAGGDLKEIGNASYEEAFLMCVRVQKSFSMLQSLKIPVIAALNGIVFGGGFELALHCDIRFCTHDTILKLPESELGLIPGAGGISILSRILSPADAAYYLFTGEQIPVDIAFQKGLIQRVCNSDDIYDQAFDFAQELCKKPAASLIAIKKVLYTNLYKDLNEGLNAEAMEFSSVLQISGRKMIEDFFKNKTNK